MTSGPIASNFEELLKVLNQVDSITFDEKKNNKLLNEFWEYDQINENGFEKIIDKTLNFNIKKKKLVKSRLLCKMLYNVFTISTYQN